VSPYWRTVFEYAAVLKADGIAGPALAHPADKCADLIAPDDRKSADVLAAPVRAGDRSL
jgi:hypothetical protein